jgi:hypothetical protein
LRPVIVSMLAVSSAAKAAEVRRKKVGIRLNFMGEECLPKIAKPDETPVTLKL